MTGWRLGYAIAHEELTDALRKVHDFTTVCAPTPLQAAMVAALRMPDSYYTGLVEFYTTRRARMLDILGAHGFASHRPEGAYYTMADFRHLGRGDDDVAFAYWLIDEVGVATVPGSSFYVSDPSLGRGFVRFDMRIPGRFIVRVSREPGSSVPELAPPPAPSARATPEVSRTI